MLRDLPLGERLDVGAGQLHHADRLALAQERHAEKGAYVADVGDRRRPGKFVFRVGGNIGNLDDLTFERGRAWRNPMP